MKICSSIEVAIDKDWNIYRIDQKDIVTLALYEINDYTFAKKLEDLG